MTPQPQPSRPATPDDVLQALERLARSNEDLRAEIRELRGAVQALTVRPAPGPQPWQAGAPRTAPPLPARAPSVMAPPPGYPSPAMVPPPGYPRPAPANPSPSNPAPPRPVPQPSAPPRARPPRLAQQGPAPSTPGPAGSRITGPVVIGVVGVAVLLAGITMLLVLAAQHGYFGPLARVVATACLAAGLLVAGFLVHRRQRSNTGALALAGAGLAAGYLDVTAMSWLLDVGVRPALVLAGLLAVAGLGLAWWWDAQAVAVVATLGALVLVPFVSGGDAVTSAAFLVLLTAVTTPASWRRGWTVLLVCRLAPTVVYLCVLAGLADGSGPDAPLLRLAAAIVAALPFADHWALAPACAAMGRLAAPGADGAARRDLDRATVRAHDSAVAPMAAPLWIAALTASGGWAAALGLPLAAVGAAHWRLGKGPTMRAGAVVVTAMGVVAVPIAALEGPSRMLAVVVLGIVFAVLHRLTGQLAPLIVAAVLALSGLPEALGGLSGPPSGALPAVTVGIALTRCAAGAAQLAAVVLVLHSVGGLARRHAAGPAQAAATGAGWTVAAVASGCLLLQNPVMWATVALSRGTGVPSGPEVTGRGVTTLLLAAAVTVLMLRSRGADRASAIRRTSGYVLMGAILTKLCLYDLVVLDGVVRVVAFIGVGLLMLGLATVYARGLEPGEGSGRPAGRSGTSDRAEHH